jgi:hypothetical protein
MILTISSDDDGYLIYSLSRRREREGVRVDIYNFPPHLTSSPLWGEEIMISYVLGITT